MLMVLLYFIAVMLETGMGVWIFGKMFPNDEKNIPEREKKRIGFCSLLYYLHINVNNGYLGIEC